MKVAIVNKFFFLNGGQETVALEQMKLLEKAGIQTAFFSMHHPKNPPGYYWSKYFADTVDFSLQTGKPSLLNKLSLGAKFIYNATVARKFGAFLDEFQPDIIHCHGIAHQLTYSILDEAAKRRIPIVQTLHDYQPLCPNYTFLQGGRQVCESGCTTGNFLPCVLNRCVKNSYGASVLSAVEMFFNRAVKDYTRQVSLFISPSRFLAEKVVASGINAQKVKHLRNFLVNMELPDKSLPSRQASDLVSGAPEGYLLYIGRLSYEKGLMTLLKAARQTPAIALRIAGDGALRETLRTYCETHHMENVTFLGHLNAAGIEDAIQGASAIVLPSEWYENQPMSIIEAFAREKPVIAANIGGIPEMIQDGQNGFLFQPGDVQALASIMRKTAANPEQLAAMGRNARQDALQHYNAEAHLQGLLDIYRTLMPAHDTAHNALQPLSPAV